MKINRRLFYILIFLVVCCAVFILNIRVEDQPVKGYVEYEENFSGQYNAQYCSAEVNWDVRCELTGCLTAGEIKVLLLDGGFAKKDYSDEDIIEEWTISKTGKFNLLIDVGDVSPEANKTVVIIGSDKTKVLNFKIESKSKSKLYEVLL